MKILITGANGFVGKNLVLSLNQIMKGNDLTRPNLKIDEIYSYDINDSESKLEEYCSKCDFIFHLAGVNRPTNPEEYKSGNYDFLGKIMKLLINKNNVCPIMLSSSIQASLIDRYANSEYGKSKQAAERLLFEYGNRFNVKTFIFRFPNLFGKWCKPNYNSAVATFCYNYAHDLPIQVNDPNTELELLYIDDLVQEMLNVLENKEHRCDYNGLNKIITDNGRYCFVPNTYNVTLGEIVNCLDEIKKQSTTLIVPDIKEGSFMKKLYSTYLSYLPKEKVVIDLKKNEDDRGSFTELVKTVGGGQFSVNISKPGVTKGQHFHNSKWEFFIVIKGRALIQERNLLTGELYEFEVNGDNPQAVHMLPGYTHNIINMSNIVELVTLMWANEVFDKNKPDTYHEDV